MKVNQVTVNGQELTVGDLVRRILPGPFVKPIGESIAVNEITDHKPIDGARRSDCIALLDDYTWEFIWNLYKEI